MKNLKVANKLLIFLENMFFAFNKQILNVLLTHFTFVCLFVCFFFNFVDFHFCANLTSQSLRWAKVELPTLSLPC